MDKDEYYRDILEGLSIYLDSSFIQDILTTLSQFDVPDLGAALNKNQVRGKTWLVDQMHAAIGTELGTVYVLGGWHGVLAAMLLHDPRVNIRMAVNIDKDPRCKPIAESLNRTHAQVDAFRAVTADMMTLDYAELLSVDPSSELPDVLINTSCEHVEQFAQWYRQIPPGTLQVLQSNDYYACEEHTNCSADLESFARAAPMRDLLYAGALELKKYTRFMLIGRH